MKNLSIRTKVTLWFSVSLIIVVALTFVSILFVSNQVIQKTIKDTLIETVEANIDEVEYYPEILQDELDNDADYYLEYGDGFLEIDDDFLHSVNSVSSAVYDSKKEIIFGENPIAPETADLEFQNKEIQEIKVDGVKYYVFDRKIRNIDVEGIWLRGVVSEEQGSLQIHSISSISLIALIIILIIAILGGNLVAGKMLRPMEQITAAASKISKGNDLKERLYIGPGKDEIHRLADSFNEMIGRLDKSFENEKQFTSDVSHELRTPIAVIMTQSEFALENPCSEEEYRNALQVIRRQTGKMSDMVNDMLTFVRLGNENVVYEKKKLNLSALTDTVCEEMSIIGEKDILLSYEIAGDVFVNGNEELLTRLVGNLISNGYKYGKPSGNIRVRLETEDNRAVLTVEDDGIGIAPENQERIFNRFYQVDGSRNSRGTGLGLSMVREIATYHGGTVEVESQIEKGSKFILKIPLF